MKRHPHPFKQISPEGHRTKHNNPGLFAVGNPQVSGETRLSGERVLIWERKESDSYFADIAGWQKLAIDPTGLNMGNVGAIKIPRGTRTANTLLAGYEAWAGEKSTVLSFIGEYTRKVQKVFGPGNIDTSVTLNSVALTREGAVFVTPPHSLENDRTKIDTWKRSLITEAETALQNTVTFQPIETVIAEFSAKLDDATKVRPL